MLDDNVNSQPSFCITQKSNNSKQGHVVTCMTEITNYKELMDWINQGGKGEMVRELEKE